MCELKEPLPKNPQSGKLRAGIQITWGRRVECTEFSLVLKSVLLREVSGLRITFQIEY